MPPRSVQSLNDPTQLAAQICTENRRALAQAITLIESERPDHRQKANDLIDILLKPEAARAGNPSNSMRIGITGPPGAGKSSFIEKFGLYALAQGHKLGVVAIDPSLWGSGGSILGDKTRMELLSREANAFIRPSPTRGNLGGVTRHTSEMIVLMEAAGFDCIIIETVGVGQSEMAVADVSDCLVLILPPAAGDELQGIKGGILERADAILINKADGDLLAAAETTLSDYQAAMRLLMARNRHRRCEIMTVSALTGKNLAKTYEFIIEFNRQATQSGTKSARRAAQAGAIFDQELNAIWREAVLRDPARVALYHQARANVENGLSTPAQAAQLLIEQLLA
ncbi:MAG: methylmalonyl Co-A mutase-associated GTPase MeaB [Alphaproteobacteria bacterium]|nr:methylmalonyl Co-A mutase-associated GTPase MeaB [Alphaproteobacteria bacterium]